MLHNGCNVIFHRNAAMALTQQLVQRIQNGFPRLPRFSPCDICKVGCTAVDVQAVYALQNQVDHSLQRGYKQITVRNQLWAERAVHLCNPSTQEADTGGSLQVQR